MAARTARPPAPSPTTSAFRRILSNVHMLRFFDRQGLAVNDGIGDGSPSRLEKPLNRSSRHGHRLCSLLLMEAFVVAESDRLEFIQADFDDIGLGQRDPGRLEEVEAGEPATGTRLLRSRHVASIDPF